MCQKWFCSIYWDIEGSSFKQAGLLSARFVSILMSRVLAFREHGQLWSVACMWPVAIIVKTSCICNNLRWWLSLCPLCASWLGEFYLSVARTWNVAVKRENEMLRLSSEVIKVCDFRQHKVRLSAADAADWAAGEIKSVFGAVAEWSLNSVWAGLPTGSFHCQVTQIGHFSRRLSVKIIIVSLAFFGILQVSLAVKCHI